MGGKLHLWLVIFFVFIIALSGCGGDGGSNGDGDNTNPPINTQEDTIAPSIPTDFTATPVSDSRIDLSWNTSTDNVEVAGYKLYRDGAYLKSITESTTVDTSDTGLSASLEYCYTVSAYDGAGNESEQSSKVCAVASAPFWKKISEVGAGAIGGGGDEQLKCTSNGFIFWWEAHCFYGDIGAGMPLKRSADGGASWIDALSPVGGAGIYGFEEPQNGYFFALTEKLSDPYGGGKIGNNKLYRSIDNGDTWEEVLNPNQDQLYQWGIISLNNGTLLCLINGLVYNSLDSYYKLHKSTDNGDTWTIFNPVPSLNELSGLKISPSGKIFITYFDGSSTDYYYSLDNGDTWIQKSTTKSMIYILFSSINLPTGEMIGRGSGKLYLSSDDGEIWTEISSNIADLTLKAVNSLAHIFAEKDGYIYSSIDKGSTWNKLDSGLPPIALDYLNLN